MDFMLNIPIRNGFDFWREVDKLNKFSTTKELAEVGGLNYVRMRNQRSEGRIPGSVDLLLISKVLGVSSEYLLTGHSTEVSLPVTPEGMEDIVDALGHATLDERNMVRRLLNIREKGGSYSSRQEA